MKDLKTIFFGTPQFAAIILEKLIEAGFIPQAVVCNPDKPVGRKKIITPPSVKSLIMKHGTWNIPILQPEKLDKSLILHVSSFMPDLFIVAAYSQIIPKEILEISRFGTVGVHPSLLPKYRGPSPIQTTILNGDEETGVSLFLIDERIDHGKIIATSHLPLATSDNYESLSKKLADLGADLLIETLPKFINGEITPIAQDESQATYTKKFSTENAYIKPQDLEKAQQDGGQVALEIDRKIRALNPEPGVWTIQNGKRMKILEAILTPEGKSKLKRIQFEGKIPVEIV